MAGSTTRNAAQGSMNHYSYQDVTPLDYSTPDLALTTKVYHGVSIVVGSGDIVGRIQSWQPDAYTREGVHLYELADKSWGRPVEYVPGKATGFTISVTRAEVWDAEMEKAVGFAKLFNDLIDQNRPFKIKEFWIKGNTGTTQIWEYSGCWFQNKNIDAITSDGDGISRVTATLAYVSHRLIS